MDEVKGRLQVHGNHGVPLLLSHAQHQAVLRNTCVVDQNIDGPKLFLHGLDDFLGLRKVGSIRGIALGLDTLGCNLPLRLRIDLQVSKCNVCTFFGKLQGNGLSNTACSTRYQCCLSFQ